MLLAIKVIAIQLAWFGSIAVYLSSKQQVYLIKPLKKYAAWLVFLFLSLVSMLLLSSLYHWLTASIYLLMVWMITWVLLALWSPHYKKAKVVFGVGSLLMLGTSLLGGIHVV